MDGARAGERARASARGREKIIMRADLRSVAHRRLLGIDLGARYVGLAARTSVHRPPFPCGLIEGMPPQQRHHAGRAPANVQWEWTLQRARDSDVALDRFGSAGAARPPRGRATRHGALAEALATALDEHEAEVAVIGMPYHADGSRSRECAIVEQQVATLQAAWPRPIPVLFWDESFSTRRVLGPRRPQAGSRRDRGSHALVACLILEEVVEALQPLEVAAPGDG